MNDLEPNNNLDLDASGNEEAGADKESGENKETAGEKKESGENKESTEEKQESGENKESTEEKQESEENKESTEEKQESEENKAEVSSAYQSSYVALARRYRPSRLEDIIGQPTLVSTLKHALSSQRLAHAFLFTGIRGTGKTSTARILAKCFNCVGKDGNGNITPFPCLECRFCCDIEERRLLDVSEIDAASHNGVDNAREIVSLLQYKPQSRFRIIILDEVHMLSTAAFNALLKTLEEPPPFVKFIFATTNVEKIPATIISRCQRFDLRPVSPEELVEHISLICKQENTQIDKKASQILVKAAEGSVRDALSLLDRAIALANGKTISVEITKQMLGLVGKIHLIELIEKIISNQPQAVMQKVRELYSQGADPSQLISEILEIIHHITLIKISSSDPKNVQDQELNQISKVLDIPKLSRLWQILLQGLQEINLAPNPMDALEMVLIRVVFAAQIGTPQSQTKASYSPSSPAPPPSPTQNHLHPTNIVPPNTHHTHDSKLPDSNLSDSPPTDSKLPDSKLPDSKPTDSNLSDSPPTDSKLPDSKLPDSIPTDSIPTDSIPTDSINDPYLSEDDKKIVQQVKKVFPKAQLVESSPITKLNDNPLSDSQ